MDNRLFAIARLLKNEETVADIGTDHGFLPIFLIENGYSTDDLKLEGNTISSPMNGNLDFYSTYTRADFISQMKSAIEQ